MSTPKLIWHIGPAFDFFISLMILHSPGDFALRAAWAAGMRQRFPAQERELLEKLHEDHVISPPFRWLSTLPTPKNSMTALEALSELSPVERLAVLADVEPDVREVLMGVAAQGKWDDDDLQAMLAHYQGHKKKKPNLKEHIAKTLAVWAEAERYGEGVLPALQTYYDVFFAEEERRILPALENGVAKAKKLAEELDVLALMQQLSQGVQFEALEDVDELVLVPSFWVSPFIFLTWIGKRQRMMVFGARPVDASLVPGEVVPDSLVNAIKALSDPTRLRIMRYLSRETLTPTQLAQRLRLRTPTVVHHLRALRAAGLVNVPFKDKEGGYQARIESILGVCDALHQFVTGEDDT